MVALKNVNKLIFKIILEICLVFLFVFCITFSWKNFDASGIEYALAFQANPVYSYLQIESTINYAMFPMENEYALKKLVPGKVRVINPSLTGENYSLFLKMDDSSLEYQYLNISINDQIFSLKELYTKNEKDYFYFLLDQAFLTGGENLYEIKLWINNFAPNSMQGKTISFSFELEINR